MRYYCPARISPHCTRGGGRPTRQRCGHCGSELITESGRWCTFGWNASGRYPLAAAVSTHTSAKRAERAASGTDLVVRFVGE
jgi:hypothetical protein